YFPCASTVSAPRTGAPWGLDPIRDTDPMELEDRVAIVTGGAVGTGRAIAERLAAEGAVVAVADVDDTGAGETVARIATAGGRAERVHADARAAGDLADLVA